MENGEIRSTRARKKPRRRRRWSSGRALARPTRPPICKSACRGTQCPVPQNGCGGTCLVPAGVSEHKMHDNSGRFVVYFLLTHTQLSPIPAQSQPNLSPISAQSQPNLSPIPRLSFGQDNKRHPPLKYGYVCVVGFHRSNHRS